MHLGVSGRIWAYLVESVCTWWPGTLGGGGGALGTQGPQGALVLFLFALMYEGGGVGECGGDARTWVVD